MKKMMRIAAGLAALVLVAVLAGCKGKEKSNMSVEIVGPMWIYSEPHEVPEGFEYGGEIRYEYTHDFVYWFETDGTFFYSDETNIGPSKWADGTYIVNTKKGEIALMKTAGNGGADNYTLKIKGDTLVDEEGLVFTKRQ